MTAQFGGQAPLSDKVLDFQWVPGRGPDREALQRLQANFPKPADPMGEAWFLDDDRGKFYYLVEFDPVDLPINRLTPPLEELASGTVSFGPLPEWTDWFHHLLAQLIPRAYEQYACDYLTEILITGFISQYPCGIQSEPYAGFGRDVLITLGRRHMGGDLWSGRETRPAKFLHQPPWQPTDNSTEPKPWGWRETSSDFSAQMFFCLKYLPCAGIDPWVRSLLSIPDGRWNAQLMVWLLGARRFLEGEITQPDQFPDKYGGEEPKIDWSWSHCLKGRYRSHFEGEYYQAEFVTPENLMAFGEAIASYCDRTLFGNWLNAFEDIDYLKDELGNLPERFRSHYLP